MAELARFSNQLIMAINPSIFRSILYLSAAWAAGLFAACERTSPGDPVTEPRADKPSQPGPAESERAGSPELPGLYVLRLGDGMTLTNHVGIPQALLRFSVDGSRVGRVEQWEAPSTGVERVNSVAAAQSMGGLRLSHDGNYLVFTGRDQEVGRLRENVPQVIARFSLEDRVFDTSTRVPADDVDGHYRAAVSLDGRGYWAVGSSGGIHYIEHGADSVNQVLDVTHHYRNIAVEFDTLWFSRSAAGTRGLYRIDPPGVPTSGESGRVNLAAAGGRGWDRGSGGYGDFAFWNENIVFIGNNHVIEVFERDDPESDVWNRLDGENQSHATAGGQVHLDVLERNGTVSLFYTQGTGTIDIGDSGLWSVEWDAATRTFGEANHLAEAGFGYSFGGIVLHGTTPPGEPVEVAGIREPFIPEDPDRTEIPADGAFHLDNPYDFSGYRHKVQLHSHTNLSDGDHEPSWVMRAYEAIGYAAVAITDHDHMSWTPALEDPGGHNIVFLPGVEYSGTRSQSWDHMIAVGVDSIYHKDGMLNRAAQIRQARRDGGAAWLAHPYDADARHRRGWDRHQVIDPALDFDGMEIHNGGFYISETPGIDFPYKVDAALLSGKEIQVIAVDDFHRNPEATLDRGFVVINSAVDGDDLTDADVLEALRAGNFFAAGRTRTDHPAPPEFTDIRVDGHTLRVETDQSCTIDFINVSHNYYTRHELDREPFIHRVTGATAAEYDVSPEDRWVRVKATRHGETGDAYAWSNPIHIRAGEP